MRNGIDAYQTTKKRDPDRLEALVSAGYLKKIPTDPFTGRADAWRTTRSTTDPSAQDARPGAERPASRPTRVAG
jgi:general secretion pathway protein G